MGTLRKLRKSIDPPPQPAILFLPDDKFDGNIADTITVIDKKLYTRLLEGVTQALNTGRAGVKRYAPKEGVKND